MVQDQINLYTSIHEDGRYFGEVCAESADGTETQLYCSGFHATRVDAHTDAWQWAQLHAYSFDPVEFA